MRFELNDCDLLHELRIWNHAPQLCAFDQGCGRLLLCFSPLLFCETKRVFGHNDALCRVVIWSAAHKVCHSH